MNDDEAAKYLLLGGEIVECEVYAEGYISSIEINTVPVQINYKGQQINIPSAPHNVNVTRRIEFMADYIPNDAELTGDRFMIVRIK